MRAVQLRTFLVTSVCAATCLAGGPAGQDLETGHVSWWIQTYGVVDTTKEPFAARAEEVFDRVAAAADKRAKQLPKMAILDADGSPFAMALPDGTVLLTRGALRICYQNVSENVGDARLAFVIGHELSHLGNDDFWHSGAFLATDIEGSSELMDHIVEKWFKGSPEEAAGRELKADAYGALYMTIAGYDPRVLLKEESFFNEWATELDALGIRTAKTHPQPEERTVFLKTQLESIANELDFFNFGTRLVQLGRYQDGLLLLERFRENFPSREVLNNIGVAHYQLAARFLGECDGRLVTRFMLPTELDSETRAVRLRGHAKSGCLEATRFRRHYRESMRNLESSSRMDPGYVTARMNQLSLFALSQEGSQAYVVADGLKTLLPEDPRVLSGAAIALYLIGDESGLKVADTAIEQLQLLRKNHPESREVAYNLASMLAERRRVQAAEDTYAAFLLLETSGPFADVARDYVGSTPAGQDVDAFSHEAPSRPPLPLGPLRPALEQRDPRNMRIEPFVIGDFSGHFIHFDNASALAISDTVELVEERLNQPARSEFRNQMGPPARTLVATTETLAIYPRFAFVIRNDLVVAVVHVAD